MISLIIGNRGSGKTKKLIESVNETAKISKGNVVCVEKGKVLMFDLNSGVRLIDVEEYGVNGAETYYGFLSGICAANYDVTHVFCDATFKIVGRDIDLVTDFIERVSALAEETSTHFIFTLSCDERDLPDRMFKYAGRL